MTKNFKPWVVFFSTFPPKECGIATYTSDLIRAFNNWFSFSVESKVVAINPDATTRYNYPKILIQQINRQKPKDYETLAMRFNQMPQIKLINIQHEFGIFGGKYGSHLEGFLKKIKKPVITTLHTVLPNAPVKMQRTTKLIFEKSTAVTVMTHLSKNILEKQYPNYAKKIFVIPHGIHPIQYTPNSKYKISLGLKGKLIATTFGLLNKGKGIEYVLRALPSVVKKFPNLFYYILGVTHPEVLKRDGEAYRNFLQKEVMRLRLQDHVFFYNRYFSLPELLKFLQATDVYICPSLNPNQAVSGTLSYALGTGRPVISTAFAQAKEDITNDVGILVDFKKPLDYTQALIRLLNDNNLREHMGTKAYVKTHGRIWPNIALAYMRLFMKHLPRIVAQNKHLPGIKLDQLLNLTDNFGILQFAKLNVGDKASGYTLDDNARALVTTVRYYQKNQGAKIINLIKIYLTFINYALSPKGQFLNYFTSKQRPNYKANLAMDLEDTNARALWALMTVSTIKVLPKIFRAKAKSLYKKRLAAKVDFIHPRAMAFYIKGLFYVCNRSKNKILLAELNKYCQKLVTLYIQNHSRKWQWFENKLTYSNSILSEALLLGYLITKNPEYLKVGKITLEFLIKKTFLNGLYCPVGQDGWYQRGGRRTYFDQQPEETASMVQTLKVMYELTGKLYYQRLMLIAFNWFLGENSLRQCVYNCVSGGCFDGLGRKEINLNQGAESTISYLLARLAIGS